MAKTSRLLLHNRTYEICFRTEEGLPLIPTAYMAAILTGIVAKAQLLHPVTLCHAVVMNNHPHLMAVIDDPEDAFKFIAYIKRESAHAINRLLGRKGRKTVWQAGYDSTLILDTKKALERIAYYYLNPAKAHLVSSIAEYPNLNTWTIFCNGERTSIRTKRIARDAICALPNRQLDEREQAELAAALLETSEEELTLVVEPDAWLSTMVDGVGQNRQMLREEVIRTVLAQEKRLAEKRKRSVLGSSMLRLQDMRKRYLPTKQGQKTHCLSSIRSLRNQVITWMKDYAKAWQEKKATLTTLERLVNMPPGMFSPGGKLRSNLNPAFIPF